MRAPNDGATGTSPRRSRFDSLAVTGAVADPLPFTPLEAAALLPDRSPLVRLTRLVARSITGAFGKKSDDRSAL